MAAGYIVTDEPDMNPGWWCAPSQQQYNAKANLLAGVPKDGRATMVNFGLGIMASRDCGLDPKPYVQGFGAYESDDQYFYTDDGFEDSRAVGLADNRLTTEQTRRASNYGIVVNRLRDMNDHKIPVWGFVEVGCPFTNGNCINANQVRAAMWHEIIAGARGIDLFNHSFSGSCQNNSDLRQACYAAVRSMVQSVTAQIQQIAPALNGPEASGLVTVSEPSGCFPSGSPGWMLRRSGTTALRSSWPATMTTRPAPRRSPSLARGPL
ncbi:MAG: hypothetical protein HOQ07_07700 [Sinomonas sp.]|nr:hypothetical protein [Sinomonas sp.]